MQRLFLSTMVVALPLSAPVPAFAAMPLPQVSLPAQIVVQPASSKGLIPLPKADLPKFSVPGQQVPNNLPPVQGGIKPLNNAGKGPPPAKPPIKSLNRTPAQPIAPKVATTVPDAPPPPKTSWMDPNVKAASAPVAPAAKNAMLEDLNGGTVLRAENGGFVLPDGRTVTYGADGSRSVSNSARLLSEAEVAQKQALDEGILMFEFGGDGSVLRLVSSNSGREVFFNPATRNFIGKQQSGPRWGPQIRPASVVPSSRNPTSWTTPFIKDTSLPVSPLQRAAIVEDLNNGRVIRTEMGNFIDTTGNRVLYDANGARQIDPNQRRALTDAEFLQKQMLNTKALRFEFGGADGNVLKLVNARSGREVFYNSATNNFPAKSIPAAAPATPVATPVARIQPLNQAAPAVSPAAARANADVTPSNIPGYDVAGPLPPVTYSQLLPDVPPAPPRYAQPDDTLEF